MVNNSKKIIALFFMLITFWTKQGFAQTTPIPTSPSGTNSVVYYTEPAGDYGYYFKFNGINIYKYSIPNSWSFHGIMAIDQTNPSNVFLPSNYGGPIFQSPYHDAKMPWDTDMSHSCIYFNLTGNTVTVRWVMTEISTGASSTYQYQLYISGRTLVINVQELNLSTNTVGFTLDRSEWGVPPAGAYSPLIVKIPYLPLFNMLYCNELYTSLFFDWEKTKCSRYDRPVLSSSGLGVVISQSSPTSEIVSPSSVVYAPLITYIRTMLPNWSRPPLDETIYLTVSPDISGALPNLVSPTNPTPNVSAAMAKTVLFYGGPYPWLLTLGDHANPYPYKLLDSLNSLSIGNLAVIMQVYQAYGYDQRLPDVLEYSSGNPGAFLSGFIWCGTPGIGSKSDLFALRNQVVNTLGFGFGLHQNYFEYYPSSNWVNSHGGDATFGMKNPGSDVATNILTCTERALVFKPTKVAQVATDWATHIQGWYNPNWTYLDVTTSMNPLEWADYDNNCEGAGSSLYTLQRYRELAGKFNNSGPVIGEGGFQFLYAGYWDDFEGRLMTADYNITGIDAPLFVDFDLYKMHGRSAQHGPGHLNSFFRDENNKRSMTPNEILTYVATELAFGHGGLITKWDYPTSDHTIQQAMIEKTHVYPLQIAYATAHPVSIQYGNALQSASEYIKTHPDYANRTHPDFMGKVKITYDNGVVVCVNRSSSEWTVDGIGVSGGWFTKNTTDVSEPIAGISNTTSFTLKANNGWVCYNPLIGNISGPTDVYHPEKYQAPITYSWNASSNATPPLTYTWKKNGSVVGSNSSTYSETYGFDGFSGGSSTYTLSVTVTDSRGNIGTKDITVTEYHSGSFVKRGQNQEINIHQIPTEFSIKQNYPNPFNPTTKISYGIPEISNVRIIVYDRLGREVETLINKQQQPGYYDVKFDANKLSSGIYFYKIQAGSFILSKKMLLLK